MKCRLANRLISAYIDDELPGEQMAGVREHLATCRECELAYQRTLQLKRSLQGLEAVEPTDMPSLSGARSSERAQMRLLPVASAIVAIAVTAALLITATPQPEPTQPAAARGIAQQTPIEPPYDPYGHNVEFFMANFEQE